MLTCARFSLCLVLSVFAVSLAAQSNTDPTTLQNQKTLLQLQIDVATLQNQLAALQAAPAAPTLTDQLTTAKNIADLKSAITTDQVTQIKTAIGSIDTSKLPSGTATLTNVDIQPTILGYEALQTALTSIKLKACTPDATIVIGPGSLDDINVLQAYQAIVSQVHEKLKRYQTVPNYDQPRVQSQILPAAIFAGIDAAVALTSLFKSDVTMNGVDFTADAVAARFIMAHALTSGTPASGSVPAQAGCAVIDANDFIGPVANSGTFAQDVGDLGADIDAANITENTIKTVNIPAYTKAVADAQAIEVKAKSLSDEIDASNKKLSDPKTTAKDRASLIKTVADDTKALAALDVAQSVEARVKILNDEIDASRKKLSDLNITEEEKASFKKIIADDTKAVADAQAIEAKAKSLSDEIDASNKKLRDPKITAEEKASLSKTVADDTKAHAALAVAQAKADEATDTNKLKSASSDVTIIDSLTAAAAKLINTLDTVDSSGSPYLARMMKAEAVSLKTDGFPVLRLSVSKIGGNTITRKNVFRTAIQFGGGVVVQYQLKDSDGLTVLESGQVTGYTVTNEKAKPIVQWPKPRS